MSHFIRGVTIILCTAQTVHVAVGKIVLLAEKSILKGRSHLSQIRLSTKPKWNTTLINGNMLL